MTIISYMLYLAIIIACRVIKLVKERYNMQRTRVVYMHKKKLFDALNEMYENSKELRQPKLGWIEFRDRIDKTRIILQHGLGVNSDQEREFMHIEYAPNINGQKVMGGSPFQSVESLAWYSEGITKAQLCLVNIMDEMVKFCVVKKTVI